MNEPIFLTTTARGIGRAVPDDCGNWTTETHLPDQDVRCLAADPRHPGLVYAGTQGNGLWRSPDYGCSWQSVGLPGQIVKAIAASPHQPGLLYAGLKPASLVRSADGGDSWQELPGFQRIPGRRWWFSPAERPYQAYVQAIALSPTEPDLLLVGIEFGAVVRSADGGETWSGHRSGALRDCHCLTFHATDGAFIYEAGGGGASASQDAGVSWSKRNTGLARRYGVACAADPQRPGIWYVSVAPSPGKAYGAAPQAYLYRADGGATWQPISWEPQPMTQMPIALVTVPGAPGTLYAATTAGQVWRTADYGEQWQQLPFTFSSAWRSLLVLQRLPSTD